MPYVPEESVPNPYHSLSECFPTVSVADQRSISVAWGGDPGGPAGRVVVTAAGRDVGE